MRWLISRRLILDIMNCWSKKVRGCRINESFYLLFTRLEAIDIYVKLMRQSLV